MIRPLMVLIFHIQPDDPPIWVLTTHHPSLNAREDPAPLHTANIQPRSLLLEILPRAYSPRDGIPALLRVSFGGVVSHFHDELRGLVHEHHGEELVLWRVAVVLREGLEGEDFGVEGVGLLEGVAGEFQEVDAVEGGWHRWLCRGASIMNRKFDLIILICDW